MRLTIKKINLQFIFITFMLLLSISCHAFSPELLTQLRSENIVDTTGTLSKQEIQWLQQQNQKIRNDAHVSISILVLEQLPDTKENPFLMDAILDQTKSLTPNIEDQVALLIGVKSKNYLIQASDENKNVINEYYTSGITAPDNNKLRSIDHIILKPLLKKKEFYTAIRNTQIYIQQKALHQESTAEIEYYKEIFDAEQKIQNYIIFGIWTLIFSFFSISLARLLKTQIDFDKINFIAVFCVVFHAIMSIYVTSLYFDVNTIYLCIINLFILVFYHFLITQTATSKIHLLNKIPYFFVFIIFIFILILSLLFKSYRDRITFLYFFLMLFGAYIYNRMIYSIFRLIFKNRVSDT